MINYASDALEMVLAEELRKLELDLVELVRGGSRSRPMLQVRIERDDGVAVSVDDCARASRAIEARLDADHIAGERYVLEVSSPGVERRLRGPADWRRFVGRRAKVLSDALGGREEVEILGVSGEPGSEIVVLLTPRGGGSEQSVPLAEVKEARLAFHW